MMNDKLNALFKKLGVGFYLTLAVALLSIIGGITYASAVLGNATVIEYDPNFYKSNITLLALLGGIFALLALAGAVVAEFLIKDSSNWKNFAINTLAKIAPFFIFALNLIGFMLLAPNALEIIMFVAQAKSAMQAVIDSQLLLPIILLVSALILSIAAIFIPMFTKKTETFEV